MFSSSGSETSFLTATAVLTTDVHVIFITTSTNHHSSLNPWSNQSASSLPINQFLYAGKSVFISKDLPWYIFL
jgi:hypothetical protein